MVVIFIWFFHFNVDSWILLVSLSVLFQLPRIAPGISHGIIGAHQLCSNKSDLARRALTVFLWKYYKRCTFKRSFNARKINPGKHQHVSHMCIRTPRFQHWKTLAFRELLSKGKTYACIMRQRHYCGTGPRTVWLQHCAGSELWRALLNTLYNISFTVYRLCCV